MSRRRLGLRKRLALNIFSDLYSSTVAEHRLDTLFWECTLRCNLSCRHCGSDCRVDPGVRDMPIEDFLKVLDAPTSNAPGRRSPAAAMRGAW